MVPFKVACPHVPSVSTKAQDHNVKSCSWVMLGLICCHTAQIDSPVGCASLRRLLHYYPVSFMADIAIDVLRDGVLFFVQDSAW